MKKLNDSHVHKMAADIPEFEMPDWMMYDCRHRRNHHLIILTQNMNFEQFYIYSADGYRLLCRHINAHSSGTSLQDTYFHIINAFSKYQIYKYGTWCVNKGTATYDKFKHWPVNGLFFIVYVQYL